MAKWKATVLLNDDVLTMHTECEYYATAYVNILAKLPSRCSRGDCKEGIIDLVKVESEEIEPQIIRPAGENDKKSVKINILEPEDCV